MYFMLMSEKQIHNNWQVMLQDPDNPRPEIKDPNEWIAVAKAGEMKVLGATVIIQNTIPAMPNVELSGDPLAGRPTPTQG